MIVMSCQRVLDGLEMPAEWALSTGIPIFKRKGDIVGSNCYRAMNHPQHGIKMVEMVLVKVSY